MRRFGFPLLYAAILLAFCAVSHCAILSNDVFPLRWQTSHLSLLHPDTFYNGFFPIGYPLLERLAAVTGNPIVTMVLLQIALAAIYVYLAQRLLEAVVGATLAIVGLPLILFGPQILTNVLSATPDFLAGFCVLIGLWVLVMHEAKNDSSSGAHANRFLTAGVALGFGYVFRTHVIIFALALAIAALIFEDRRVRSSGLLLLGTAPFMAVQALVQVWSGHGAFESSQAFNIWRMMHGSNWSSFPNLSGMSAASVVRSEPTRFLTAWWDQILSEWLYLIPTLLAFSLPMRHGRFRSLPSFAILLLAANLYLILSATGGSPRNVILVVPIAAAAAMFVFGTVLEWLRWKLRTPSYVAAGILWLAGGTGTVILSLHAARRVQDYRAVQNLLQVHNAGDAGHIFTDDFDLYFPDFNYATPRTSGGWAEVGLPAYAARHPLISDSSASALHADLTRQGIAWAVFRIPPYDANGYSSVANDTTNFRLTYQSPKHRIYRVK